MSSRRDNRRIAGYAAVDTTPKTDKKTSKIGIFISSNHLIVLQRSSPYMCPIEISNRNGLKRNLRFLNPLNLTNIIMIKLIHVIIILISFISFISRFVLLKFKPTLLLNKFVKIAPHVIDTFLLISGVTLVFQGRWLEGEFGWIISKLILLFVYVALALVAMRSKGVNQWLAFLGAIFCYVFIFSIAITKNGFI